MSANLGAALSPEKKVMFHAVLAAVKDIEEEYPFKKTWFNFEFVNPQYPKPAPTDADRKYTEDLMNKYFELHPEER
jgi:hypothetical protein